MPPVVVASPAALVADGVGHPQIGWACRFDELAVRCISYNRAE